MRKYNVDDVVKIKEDFMTQPSNSVYCNHAMCHFAGKIFKIRSYELIGTKTVYTLNTCKSLDSKVNKDGYWLWDEKWLELVEPEININENELIGIFK